MLGQRSLCRGLAVASLAFLAWFGPVGRVAAQDDLGADASASFQKGLQHYQQQRYEEARDAFRASVDLQRHSQVAYFLGLTYARLGDSERAARYLNRAMRWEPPLAEHDRREAAAVLRWAESADPGEVWAPSGEARGTEAERERRPGASTSRSAPPPVAPAAPAPATERGRVLDPYPEAPPEAPADPKADLTGVWTSDDGARYFVRQVGDRVYWYGESPDDGASFANVFCGRRTGDKVSGEWIDVPRGAAMNVGWLEIELLENGTLRKKTSSIPYGGSTWSR